MDILIKSFNRPYYLDRCLYSIQNYLKGFDGKIIVLDDGTPTKYLDKITAKYPSVELRKSEFYSQKSEAVALKKQLTITTIPINLWLDAARDTSDYFIMLEDDIWFTSEVDFQHLKNFVSEAKTLMFKLFWLGNDKLISGKQSINEQGFVLYEPRVYTLSPFLYRLIFKMTRFKIRKIMTVLGWYSKAKDLEYYSIYSVAGAVFKKNYFLQLWEGHNNQVDEKLQLWNAVNYLSKHPQAKFGRTEKEVVKTGFATSATNLHKKYDTSIDMFEVNAVLNEAWFADEFDVNRNLSEDFPSERIEYFLGRSSISYKVADWKIWSTKFKEQYQAIGCNID